MNGTTVEFFNSGTQTFQAVPGAPPMSQVSVGAGSDVWGVDGSGNIYQYNASSQTWTHIPGELNLVQVGANGSVWGINQYGQTYYYNFATSSWVNIPGALATLSVGADGVVWGINAQQQVYRLNAAAQSWVNVPGALIQISVGNANNIWGVNAQNQVYHYNTSTQIWVNIPSAALVQVRAAFDGSVWGVDAGGNLYQWNSSTQSFNPVGSSVGGVFVGNAANVWTTNAASVVNSWFGGIAGATVTLNTPSSGATQLSGHAYNVDPNTTKVVVYALTDQWYVQPTTAAPFTNIAADGSWTASTNPWSSLVVLLVNPADYTPAATEITNPALDPGVLAYTMYPAAPVSLSFSGYTWGIKATGNGYEFAPGPLNFWSNDPSVVHVAADGLHLKNTQINGMWQCGEVYLTHSLGYGAYTVQVSSNLALLDLNTVAAPLFLYAGVNQELDNEDSGSGGLIPAPYNRFP
jgi:hypothetical protein